MKKIIIAAALVFGTLSPALATSHYAIAFYDTLRPNGHKRSQAVGNAIAYSCYSQTGTSPEAAPTQAFKDCMQAQGFRWMSTRLVQNPPSRQAASGIPKGSFIDPDTGMLCHDSGGAAICVTPPANMTIRYTSKHGLNCTRTGIASVCSSF
jgi:hypothetical protein